METLVPVEGHFDFGERNWWRQNFYADEPPHGFSQPAGNGGNQVGAGDQRCNAMKVRYLYRYTRINVTARQRPFEIFAML